MWPNPQFPADLITFTEEVLNGKLHFLCSVSLWCFVKIMITKRSSHKRCSIKMRVFKNSVKFTGKHQCQSLFFNKDVGHLFLRTPLDDCFFTNACNSKIYISKSTFSEQMQMILLYYLRFTHRLLLQEQLVPFSGSKYVSALYPLWHLGITFATHNFLHGGI